MPHSTGSLYTDEFVDNGYDNGYYHAEFLRISAPFSDLSHAQKAPNPNNLVVILEDIHAALQPLTVVAPRCGRTRPD